MSRVAANLTVARQRERLGLTCERTAELCGLSLLEYEHVEHDVNELYMVVRLGEVKQLCDALRLSLEELFELELCRQVVDEDFLRRRRKDKALSLAELSDTVGIDERMIEKAETDLASFADWVMDPVLDLARTLDVEPSCLIARL